MPFGFPTEAIREGAAEVVVPKLEAFKRGAWDYAPSRAPVFYNPIMKLNRDVAVLVLRAYQRKGGRRLSVSEPLAGCGVRGIRFAKEVSGVRRVHLNDISPEAVKMIQYNVQLNKLAGRVSIDSEDANLFLSRHAAPYRRFDYIDVDPFGAPAHYLDSAIRALRNGGLLALTATDLAPLCGVYPKAALRKYGGLPLRTEYCHELAVRLLTGCLVATAARHEIGLSMLFSHSANHYVRVYGLASYGARKADESLRKMGYIHHCFTCYRREIATGTVPAAKERCPECNSPLKTAGPLWTGNLSEREFCELVEEEAARRATKPKDRLTKLLALIKTESDAPATYYVVDKICDKLNLPIPPLRDIIVGLTEKGYETVATHFHSRGFKTNAPAKTVIETVREKVL